MAKEKLSHALASRVVRLYHDVWSNNLTNGTSGNVSIYNSDINLVALTPTGANPLTLERSQISIVDLDGNLYHGLKPTSEIEMHLEIYRARPDIKAIIHGHTIYATAVACLGQPLPPISYMIAAANQVAVPTVPYNSYGTKALADAVVKAIGLQGKAALLCNHGIITAGKNAAEALKIAIQIEYVAQLYLTAKQAGEPKIIDKTEMKKVIERFKSYGMQKT